MVLFREVAAALAEVLAPDGCFLCAHRHDPSLAAAFPSTRYAHALIAAMPTRLLGVPLESHPICPACAGALREARRPVALEGGHRLISPFLDSPELVKLVHLLKFHGLRGVAFLLGAAMARALVQQAPPHPGSVLVPVPMDRGSMRRRGFNQAALLAGVVGRTASVTVAQALVKVRRTRAQSLTAEEDRDENVRGAFRTAGESVRGRRVLIVDDLVTTGATVSACAAELEAAGAASVTVLAAGRAGVARGIGGGSTGAGTHTAKRQFHSP